MSGLDTIFRIIGLAVVSAAAIRFIWIKVNPVEPWIPDNMKDWLKRKQKK